MYETLIATLRDMSKMGMKYGMAVVKMQQAADAIEELLTERSENYAGSWKAAFEIERDEHRWIPVTERLPEENEPCIVFNKYYGPMVGWRVDGKRFRIPGSRFPDHPTHWMPLPQPPKEEADGKTAL